MQLEHWMETLNVYWMNYDIIIRLFMAQDGTKLHARFTATLLPFNFIKFNLRSCVFNSLIIIMFFQL